MLQSGDILGEMYRIEEQIGVGGGGIIFKAYHLRMEKHVAVKLIKDEVKGILKNRAEVDLMKNLRHEYIPQVHDFIEDGNDVYTVMDFVEGENMKQIMSAGRKFTETEIRKYMMQLCDAVAYLHHKNPPIIHSDIKPENIMITPDDNICLIDFNISMMSSGSGAVSMGGSHGFAAPEQYKRIVAAPAQVGEFHEETRFIRAEDFVSDTVILNEEGKILGEEGSEVSRPSIQIKDNTQKTKNLNNAYVDTRTDIYGIGATMFNLLTGRIRGENGSLDFRGAAVSSSMQKIIRKAMSPNPDKRFKTVEEMKDAIAKKSSIMPVLSAIAFVAIAAVVGIIAANYKSEETIADSNVGEAVPTVETTIVTTAETTIEKTIEATVEAVIEETEAASETQISVSSESTEEIVTAATGSSEVISSDVLEETTDNDDVTALEEHVLPQIGDDLRFGDYTWIVLDKKDNAVLITSKGSIIIDSYNDTLENVTWETCSLRKYLNNDFYDSFSDDEKLMIMDTVLVNDNNPMKKVEGGNKTTDKIFIQSIDELQQYFGTDKYDSEKYNLQESENWIWVRNPGCRENMAMGVFALDLQLTNDKDIDSGYINSDGCQVNYSRVGICPTMWINLGIE